MFDAVKLTAAGVICAMGGAIAGSAMGSAPVISRHHYDATDRAETSNLNEPGTVQDAPPDHYPLVTPRGTVPVAHLAERGLYSQARYQEPQCPQDEYAGQDFSDYHIDNAYSEPQEIRVMRGSEIDAGGPESVGERNVVQATAPSVIVSSPAVSVSSGEHASTITIASRSDE